MRERIKQRLGKLGAAGVGTVVVGIAIGVTLEIIPYTGYTISQSLAIGLFWASIGAGVFGVALIIIALVSTKQKEAETTAGNNPLDDIKADLVNMNICQRELAIKKAQQVCPKEVAIQIYNDFIAVFGNDMATFIYSLIEKTVRERTVDALIGFYKTFADILDSNQYGLKVELEEIELYKTSRMDLAQKRLKLKVGKKKGAIIQKNIDRVCSLTYGLNSSILLRGVLRTTPKLKKLIPASIKTNLEKIEASTEKAVTTMLNDLENEWKVNTNEL